MEYYMDEKWKLCKEDQKHGHNYSSHEPYSKKQSSSLPRSASTKNPLKSFSRNSSFNLSRSSSQKSTTTTNHSTHSNHKSYNLSRSSSQKCSEFTRKCSSMAKEQKAKFYIVKRCITMLLGWKKNDRDS